VVALIVFASLATGLVLLGASLAGAPAPTPAPAQTPGTAAAPRAVNVIMRDYRFDPTPLYLYAGETVELRVLNGGLVDHELVLGDASVQQAWATADADATPPAPFATAPAASVAPDVGGLRIVLPSGGSHTSLYEVPADATLQMICHLPGHVEQGMVGQVTFVEPARRTP
jgi:uncharacterized cupredoxin-like copper-binding protein